MRRHRSTLPGSSPTMRGCGTSTACSGLLSRTTTSLPSRPTATSPWLTATTAGLCCSRRTTRSSASRPWPAARRTRCSRSTRCPTSKPGLRYAPLPGTVGKRDRSAQRNQAGRWSDLQTTHMHLPPISLGRLVTIGASRTRDPASSGVRQDGHRPPVASGHATASAPNVPAATPGLGTGVDPLRGGGHGELLRPRQVHGLR